MVTLPAVVSKCVWGVVVPGGAQSCREQSELPSSITRLDPERAIGLTWAAIPRSEEHPSPLWVGLSLSIAVMLSLLV